jgi:hypothetical protein
VGSTSPVAIPRRWARPVHFGLAAIFVASVAIQIFLAGLAIFDASGSWAYHRSFVHVFEMLPILLAGVAWGGRLPVATRWAWVGVYALISMQYATVAAREAAPWVAALHPVNAFVITGIALTLTWRNRIGH